MSKRKSDRQSPIVNRSLIVDEEKEVESTIVNPNEEISNSSEIQHLSSSNISIIDSNRPRSKTASTDTSDLDLIPNELYQGSTSAPVTFNLLQSIKDLTHQELYRANPLGLLGKEVISITGTTHCPEPIPPKDDENDKIRNRSNGSTPMSSSNILNKLSPVNENEPQKVHFPLTDNIIKTQRRRSTIGNIIETVLPPCPAEFLSKSNMNDSQPQLFSQLTPGTMVADFIPDTMSINVFEVFIYAWGVIAFFFDMVTDLVLAHAYYIEGAYWLFLLTLMCVVLPNLTLSVFSLVWYIDGSQLKAAASENQTTTTNNETNSIDENNKNDQQPNPTNSELIPLHQKRNSICQTDDINFDDNDNDVYVSRLKHRLQTPEIDAQQPYLVQRKNFHLSTTTANILTWIIRIIILVLQLDLCLKYIRGLYYTWKGFQKRHDPKWQRFYLTKQILIDADIALLRVFDCFMDSGSQVTLQLYIMLRLGSISMKFDTLFLKQCLSIVSSLGSLAYALSGYSRCWRHMQLTHSPKDWPKGKPPPQMVSWWSTIIQWCWYLFLITPRVLALAMFAATFRSWFWIILVAHWCGMLFWILRFRTIFCISDQTKYNPREAIFEKCYNLVCSYIFIFCYMNLRKGDTRAHYIGFYAIYYIENIAFSIIYAIHSAETNSTFKYSLVTFVCCGFWLAVLFQFLYYRFLHPSDHVRHNMKRNISAFVHSQPLSRFKKSKSYENIIIHNDLQSLNDNNQQLVEISSLKSDQSNDERWHNRFAKENRQKLISQQQAIDHKVKLNRAQKQLEDAIKRKHQPTQGFLTRISTTLKRPTTISTSLVTQSLDNRNGLLPSNNNSSNRRKQEYFHKLPKSQNKEFYSKINQENDNNENENTKLSINSKPNKRPSQYEQKSNMYNINEDISDESQDNANLNFATNKDVL